MSSGPICVYCASSNGTHPAYMNSAISVGKALAQASRTVVYGGGMMGLMGAIAQTALDHGGHVIGVTPYAMTLAGGEGSKVQEGSAAAGQAQQHPRQLTADAHPNREDIIVDDMHERKQLMAVKATGGFVCLPGGYGTFEEMLEATTWSQLSIHVKPIIIVNVLGYYDLLRAQLAKGAEAGFIQASNLGFLTFVDGPANHAEHADYDWGKAVVDALDNWKPIQWEGFGWDWTKKKNGSVSSALHAV